jgi:hypothetical protein
MANIKATRYSSPWPVALGAAGAGLCLGLAIAWMFASEPAPAPVASRTAAVVPGSLFDPAVGAPDPAACAPLSTAALREPDAASPVPLKQTLGELARQMKSGLSADNAAAIARLIAGAQSDAALRSDLASRYKSERDADVLGALATIISSFPPQEIRDMALQLAQGDAGQRASAFRLLAASPGASASSYPILQQALDTEQDPRVLSQAVTALGPRPSLDPAQAQATLARLNALAQSADPDVRGESLRALAQWDKTGELAEPQVYKALSADDPESRANAVNAVASSALKSDRVKAALFGIAGSDAESSDTRAAALRALERFSLTSREYAAYSQLDAALAGKV